MSSSQICHVIFPGAFKPVHYGHIALMQKYLNSSEYAVKLTVLVSRGERDGLKPEASKWFLEQVFKGNLNFNVEISPKSSPIAAVYDIMGTAEYGPGYYALAASSKGADQDRSTEIVKQFNNDPTAKRHYTPGEGVKVINFPINPEPTPYIGRKDLYPNTPISSTIVRQDIRNNDYASFRTAYLPLLSGNVPMISEDILKQYFEMLKTEILPIKEQHINSSLTEDERFNYDESLVLNEGGAAGHMSHPYDYSEFTFKDLKSLIHDLFAGNITDVTEKLDGQNLFASMDEHGNTIFARTEKHLKEYPWYLGDVMNNPKWIGNPSVQHAFTNAALTIDKVFKNIPHAVDFFNYDDKADGVRYRYWLNIEILDTENFNVIPYADSKISFHTFVCMCFDYSELDKISKSEEESNCPDWDYFELDEEENKKKLEILQKAINKTTRSVFKAQITPEVIFKKLQDGEAKAKKYYDRIDTLLRNIGMPETLTIREFKVLRLMDFITNSKEMKWLDGDALDALIDRWIDNKKDPDIRAIAKTCKLSGDILMTKDQYNLLREFDKNNIKDIIKIIMRPLDSLFIKIGNEVLNRIDGLSNQGHSKEIQAVLNKTLREIKDAVESDGDEKQKRKLETNLARLAEVGNEISAAEGIVFKWHGKVMKITGAFAPLNQILSFEFRELANKKKAREND